MQRPETGDQQEEVEDHLSHTLPFVLVCCITLLGSGGLIIGVGPFIERMVKDGYFSDRCNDRESGCAEQYDAMNPIFNGGFQIMTWTSAITGILLTAWGPRYNATIGMIFLTIGCGILATAETEDGPNFFMMGYGFIGGGGNLMYISSFHFANLFENKAVPIGILGGIFNLSGLLFMLLNIPGVTIKIFFSGYSFVGMGLVVLVAIFYPDDSIEDGEGYSLKFPTYSHVSCSRVYQEICRPEVFKAVKSTRFLGFCVLFAWCTMSNVVIGGLVESLAASKSSDSDSLHIFNGYAYPIIGNSTFLFAPMVGYLIQETGFALSMTFCIVFTQISLALCWGPELVSQYFMLFFFNLTQAFAYTIEFAYIQITYPNEFYGPLIAAVITAQGLLGFIAWPGLSPNPFGPTQFTPVLLICLIPSFLLYIIPFYQRKHDKIAKREVAHVRMSGVDDSKI
ncbi:hypothetical protein AAMO2058_000245600 [Amorphochlora amoebiformis]